MDIKVGQAYVAKANCQCACGHFYLPTLTILEDLGESFRISQTDKDTTLDGKGHGDGTRENVVSKEMLIADLSDAFYLVENVVEAEKA